VHKDAELPAPAQHLILNQKLQRLRQNVPQKWTTSCFSPHLDLLAFHVTCSETTDTIRSRFIWPIFELPWRLHTCIFFVDLLCLPCPVACPCRCNREVDIRSRRSHAQFFSGRDPLCSLFARFWKTFLLTIAAARRAANEQIR